MPLSNLLKSAAGTCPCPFCHQRAGILSREHPDCRRTYQAGWNDMVRLASGAARSHEFQANSLQVSLAEIARRSYGDASTVVRALEEGWRRAFRHAASDGSITHEEEFRLRRFRDRLGLTKHPDDSLPQLQDPNTDLPLPRERFIRGHCLKAMPSS